MCNFYYIITQKHKIENLKHTTKTSLPYFDKEVTHIYAVLTFCFTIYHILFCNNRIFLNTREPRKPAKPPTMAITTP